MIEQAPLIASLTYVTKGLTIPVINSLGQLLTDNVNAWRAKNLHSILSKADGILALNDKGDIELNPKILFKIADLGSLDDAPELQSMWAGLLASSGPNDDNLHYLEILSGLTQVQAKIINRICESAKVVRGENGLIHPDESNHWSLEQIFECAGTKDIEVIDQALDDLSRKALIEGGFYVDAKNDQVEITPRALTLYFYAKACGYREISEAYNID